MTDGTVRIRLFERAETDRLHLRGSGSLDGIEVLDRDRVARVSAVIARLER
jgi:hypothetical protein